MSASEKTDSRNGQLRNPPLALYIHIPWCVKKCPYCDFNSHQQRGELPIQEYLEALQEDLENDRWMAQGRTIGSIFFGGGTPSLLPNQAIAKILEAAHQTIGITADAEITLEANPGTVEHHDFAELRASGVNRLSMGIQSFNNRHLSALGRIHDGQEAKVSVLRAQDGGFDNINIDLMHGLPDQHSDEALADIEQALALSPSHISWYQLTIEKNTEFFSKPPTLPSEENLADICEQGQRLLNDNSFQQYEISAYAKNQRTSLHNLNYWRFGDYLAIGAGAHGKITEQTNSRIFRYQKTRLPQDYLNPAKAFTSSCTDIEADNMIVEFMMNALRLTAGVALSHFCERTGLPAKTLDKSLTALKQKGLLIENTEMIVPSALGRRFLNTLLEGFLR